MASVSFRYRSKKENSTLEIVLTFRIKGFPKDKNNSPYFYYGSSLIEISKKYWQQLHFKTDFPNSRDIDKQNEIKSIKDQQYLINNEIVNIRTHILTSFNLIPNNEILKVVNKQWLQTQINHYYNPPKSKEDEEKSKIPTTLIGYIDYYSNLKKNEVTKSTLAKFEVNKNLLLRFENKKEHSFLIKEVNNQFKSDFENYCFTERYAPNTIARSLKFIKTLCRHAQNNGLEVSHHLNNMKPKYEKIDNIYLNFEELGQIENTNDLPEYLENAKDWLIISCYLGQRVSDFLNFKSEMIRYEDNRPLLEFTQKKTGKIMTIPVHKKVMEILEKRNGDFPRPISDVKYNLYIKEVCERAKLNQMVKGSKKVETAPKSKKYRKKTDMYKKWELVSSHIGRRSFATNFYGKIPTTYLIYITGHSTENMFLAYIGKSNKDLAIEVFNYFT